MITTQLRWYGKQLLAAIESSKVDAMMDAAQMLIDVAAAKAPRRTGDLASSGYVANSRMSTYQKKDTNRKEIKPKPDVVVAAFADFKAMWYEAGTSRQAARPYMRPALDELKKELGDVIVKKIRRKVDK